MVLIFILRVTPVFVEGTIFRAIRRKTRYPPPTSTNVENFTFANAVAPGNPLFFYRGEARAGSGLMTSAVEWPPGSTVTGSATDIALANFSAEPVLNAPLIRRSASSASSSTSFLVEYRFTSSIASASLSLSKISRPVRQLSARSTLTLATSKRLVAPPLRAC